MTKVLGRFENELLLGAKPSLPNKRPVFIKTALNVIADELSLQPTFGFRQFAPRPATEPILGIQTFLRAGVPTLHAATKTNIYEYTRSSGWSSVGAGFTGTNLDLWDIEPWGDWAIATNGVDVPQVDKGAGYAALGGTPPSPAIAIVPWKSFLILVTKDTVYWSDQDAPETWTALPENLAGELPARDIKSSIRAALPLGEMVVHYTLDQQRAVQFIGGNDVFGRINLDSGIGAVGRNAVCSANRRHYGWGPKGLWESDGSQYLYIDNPDVKDYIQADLNADLISRVCVFHLPQYRGIVFSYPRDGEDGNSSSVLFQYEQRAFWPQGWGRTCAVEDSAFGSPLFGDENGEIWEMPAAHGESSTAISGSAMVMRERWFGSSNRFLTPYGEQTFGALGEDIAFG